MIELRALSGVSWAELAAGFNAAFADYAVPMALSAEALEAMQVRRGYAAERSFGAFLDEELVGFCLTCRDGARAYDSGTGVVPAQRRGQLGRRLVAAVIESLNRDAIASSYVLEVIESNEPAVALYRQLGFVETRRLQCWTLAARGAAGPAGPTDDEGLTVVTSLDEAERRLNLAELLREAELEPSWQNTLASLRRAPEPLLVIGDAHGAAVLFPRSADLPFLCVRRAARRRGHGRRLLAAAAARASRALRLINLDERHAELAAFLSAAGATPTVRQLEMVRPLP